MTTPHTDRDEIHADEMLAAVIALFDDDRRHVSAATVVHFSADLLARMTLLEGITDRLDEILLMFATDVRRAIQRERM